MIRARRCLCRAPVLGLAGSGSLVCGRQRAGPAHGAVCVCARRRPPQRPGPPPHTHTPLFGSFLVPQPATYVPARPAAVSSLRRPLPFLTATLYLSVSCLPRCRSGGREVPSASICLPVPAPRPSPRVGRRAAPRTCDESVLYICYISLLTPDVLSSVISLCSQPGQRVSTAPRGWCRAVTWVSGGHKRYICDSDFVGVSPAGLALRR